MDNPALTTDPDARATTVEVEPLTASGKTEISIMGPLTATVLCLSEETAATFRESLIEQGFDVCPADDALPAQVDVLHYGSSKVALRVASAAVKGCYAEPAVALELVDILERHLRDAAA